MWSVKNDRNGLQNVKNHVYDERKVSSAERGNEEEWKKEEEEGGGQRRTEEVWRDGGIRRALAGNPGGGGR